MAEQDASRGSTGEGFDDSRYFGPFGPGQSDADPGPSYPPGPAYAAPAAHPGDHPPPPPYPAAAPRRTGPRLGAVIGLTALTAAVVGGGAGYGGARLAESTAPAAVTSTPAGKGPSSTPTPSAVPTPPVADTVAVAKRVVPSTVMIKVGRATGSGFVLDRRGRIMTNNHVVARAATAGAKITVIFAGGRRSKAALVGRSPSYDIAVVKVKTKAALRPVRLGDSDKTEVGQPVVAIGAPLGLPGTVTQGIVSAHHRPVVVSENADADTPTAYIDAIQTDAPINPGNSGGPLVDAGARIIGVNSAILTLGSSQSQTGSIGLGFAIPINQAAAIGDQLIKRGKATYPVLGADVDDARGGVELTSVLRSGPARKAGLRDGDVVTRVDGHKVVAPEELIVSVRTHRPGDRVELKYTRGSALRTARVRLGSKEG